MDQNKVEGIIRKRLKDQKNSDLVLKIFIAVFFLGNIFFLSSNLLLPQISRNVAATPIGSTYNIGDQVITFDAWDYSRRDREFEILLEVENLSLEGDPRIGFGCICNGENLSVETVKVINDSLYVLRVVKVPRRFSTAALIIATLNDADEESQESIYITDKTVGEISSADSDNDYLIYAASCKIASYKDQVRSIEDQEKDMQEKIRNSVKTIDDLEDRKKMQTEEEQKVTDELISEVSSEAENLQGEIEDALVEKAELQEKIKIQEAIIDELEGGDAS